MTVWSNRVQAICIFLFNINISVINKLLVAFNRALMFICQLEFPLLRSNVLIWVDLDIGAFLSLWSKCLDWTGDDLSSEATCNVTCFHIARISNILADNRYSSVWLNGVCLVWHHVRQRSYSLIQMEEKAKKHCTLNYNIKSNCF